MEFEFWWLLGIPVFFGLGWIAARVDINQLLSESRTLPRGYFKGLNFLLNEQPDKAIDHGSRAAPVRLQRSTDLLAPPQTLRPYASVSGG